MSAPAPGAGEAPEASRLGRQDLHAHTTLSDGAVPLARVVEIARERGVEIGIADHVSTANPRYFISSTEELRAYFAALDEQPVFRSGEFCWCDSFWRELPPELMERFDYRIGSNHGFWLPDGSVASVWLPTLDDDWSPRPQELMEIMARNLCDLVSTMPVQILAHPTLLPPALRALEADPEAWWSDEREDRLVEALAASGVALEISNRYRLPHDRLLRKAKQAGVRFSLGSDGHREEQVGRLDWATATALRVGLDDSDLFVPERALQFG